MLYLQSSNHRMDANDMKRDFTRENYQRIIQLTDDLRSKSSSQLTMLARTIKSDLLSLNLSEITRSLEQYISYRNALDHLNHMARTSITEIFENVSSLDIQYGGNVTGFGLTYSTLIELKNAITALTQANEIGADALKDGKNLYEYYNPSAIHELMIISSTNLNAKVEAIENGADFDTYTFGQIPDSIKKARIQEMEKEHPEYIQEFESVLSDPDLTEQEKLDIKYTAYSAPEPYRSIYLEHLDRYSVSVSSKTEGAYYDPNTGEIHINDSDDHFRYNPRGPYNTFFHESGHAIDDYEVKDGLFSIRDKTERFEYKGKTLNEYIVEDTRRYVSNLIDSDAHLRNMTPEEKKAVLKNLNLSDDSNFDYQGTPASNERIREYQRILQDRMRNDLRGEMNESPSDVYGGVTNNAIIGGYGHRKDDDEETYTYWYDGKGKSTGAQESELWAEFFAAKMTHDTAALESIKNHFPQAYVAMEEMARKMAESK